MTTPELQRIYPEWEIIRLLGEGAFGKVYEIRRGGGERDSIAPEERAALKVIHIPQSESEVKLLQSEGADVSAHFEELARQLSNEIATQAKLKGNSNIVSYEDRKIVPDPDGIGQTILIRMELLTPLLDLMAANSMGQAEVLRLGLDMARALLLCERFHIIHRDIKPQNIFISPAGDYKLGDFGVARQLEQTTANLSRKGTYNYMAPEVFHGRLCNATVDIYSLGIVLYTLLNGNRAPFLPSSITGSTVTNHDRESAQTKRLSGEALPPLEGVPAALNEVILRMCAFDPKDRYQNARELMAALESVAYELQGERTLSLWERTPGAAPLMDAAAEDEGSKWIDGTPYMPEKVPISEPEPEPPPPVSERKKSPGKALIAAMAGLVLVLTGVVAWLAMRGRPEAVIDAGGGTSAESTAASDVTAESETLLTTISNTTLAATATETTTLPPTTSTTKPATTATKASTTTKQSIGTTDLFEKQREAIRNNPNLTPQEKQQALKLLTYKIDKNGIFYVEHERWSSTQGFNQIYDLASPLIQMVYGTIRIKFRYNNQDWMIQMWKGRYGLEMLGGEIGVFTKPTTQAAEHYYSALPSEELVMAMDVWQHNFLTGQTKYLFTRGPEKNWWLNGFVPGSLYEFNRKSEIIMLANMQFPDQEMLGLFVSGMEKAGFRQGTPSRDNPETYITSGTSIKFCWQHIDQDAYF